ncbi:hypothetical protein GGG16DRAFT_49536 [Schizophyllum commune]
MDASAKFPRCYDFDAATERLDWLITSRLTTAPECTLGSFLQVRHRQRRTRPTYTTSQGETLQSKVSVAEYQNGRSRIAIDTESASELVLEVSGVVLDTDLPPVTNKLPPNKARFARQAITIGAFKMEAFDDALRDIDSIRQLFERSVGGSVQRSDQVGTDLGPALCTSLRYFSHKNDIDLQDIIPFSKEVDPLKYLQALGTETLVHTRSNVVHFYEYDTDSKSGHGKYTTCPPAAVKIGDLVTCKIAFVLVPMPKGGKYRWKMLNELKAVAVMDSSPTREASTTASMQDLRVDAVEAPQVKRANLSFAGTLGPAPKRSRRMSIEFE